MKIARKDISEINTFKKYGDRFTKVYEDDTNHIYVFRRDNDHHAAPTYEVVCGIKHVNPDGSVVYGYPFDRDWGKYGFTVCGNSPGYEEKIKGYIERFRQRVSNQEV